MNLAERMRTERKERKLSQEEVAHRASVSLRTYNALERGEAVDPHFSTLRGIADALGVPVAALTEPAPSGPGPRGSGGRPLMGEEPVPLGKASSESSDEQRRKMLEAIGRYAERRASDFEQELNDPNSAHFIDATRATLWIAMVQSEAKTWADWAIEKAPTLLSNSNGEEDALGDTIRDTFRILGHLLTLNAITRKAEKRIESMTDAPDELAVRRLEKDRQAAQESRQHLQELWGTA